MSIRQDILSPEGEVWLFIRSLIESYVGQRSASGGKPPPLASIQQFCERHRIAPIVAKQLLSRPEFAGTEYSIWAKQCLLGNTQRLLRQLACLRELQSDTQIPDFKVVKGVGLAATWYNEISDRHFGDIDLLVEAPDDVLQLENILLAKGCIAYESCSAYPPRLQSLYFRTAKDSSYLLPDGDGLLELHWLKPDQGIFPGFMAVGSAYDAISYSGLSLKVLKPAEQFLYLCGHGSRSTWRRLKWLVDVYLLSQTFKDADWEKVSTLARKEGMVKHLAITVRMLDIWFDSGNVLPALQARSSALVAGRVCISHQQSWTVDGWKTPGEYVVSAWYYYSLGGLRWRCRNICKVLFRIEDFKSFPFGTWAAVLVAPVLRPVSAIYRWCSRHF